MNLRRLLCLPRGFRCVPMNLAGKIVLANTVMIAILLAVVIGYVLFAALEKPEEEIEEHTENLARISAAAITEAVVSHDLATLENFADTIIGGHDIAYVRITDASGRVMVNREHPAHAAGEADVPAEEILHVSAPVTVDGRHFGDLAIGIETHEIAEATAALTRDLVIGGIVGVLCIALFTHLFLRLFTRRLHNLRDALGGLVQGDVDFNVTLPVQGEDEVAQIAMFFNLFVGKLKDMVDQILFVAEGLSASSLRAQEITATTSSAIEDQAGAIGRFAQDIDTLAKSSEQVSREAGEVAAQASDVQQQAEEGRGELETAVRSMEALRQQVAETRTIVSELAENHNHIGKVLDMIVSIAEQTNLLALNAAIEAARAGEHGRGFAVVADEVRNLSQRTTEATDEIRQLMDVIATGSNRAVACMDENEAKAGESLQQIREAGDSFERIAAAIVAIQGSSANSAHLAQEEQALAQRIHGTIVQIDENVQRLVAMARQSISDNSDLSQYSVQLEALVGAYSGRKKEAPAPVEEVAEVELF